MSVALLHSHSVEEKQKLYLNLLRRKAKLRELKVEEKQKLYLNDVLEIAIVPATAC